MNTLLDAVRNRKNIRGYKKDPVPRALLEEVLETAICSPSALNTNFNGQIPGA